MTKPNLPIVTGASGYVGYALVLELIARGQRPRVLLRKPIPLFDNLPCDIAIGDVTDAESLQRAFAGADVVCHVAGLVDISNSRNALLWRVNVDGTNNVIAACKACGVGRLVYCSSVDAIAPAPHGTIMHESARYGISGLSGTYAKTKAVATQAVLNSAGEGFDAVACLPSAVIGPYDQKGSAIGEIVRLAMRFRSPAGLSGGGYNFVDVRDVAQGLAAAASAPSGESYLLTGEYLDVGAFLALLAELTGHRPPSVLFPLGVAAAAAPAAELFYRLSGQTPMFTRYALRKLRENGQFCHQKAARDLGFSPRSARDSLTDMIAWIRENT